MIFGINTTRDVSKLSQISRAAKSFIRLSACEITYKSYNNFEISLLVFMPNITTNHAVILPILMAKSSSIFLVPSLNELTFISFYWAVYVRNLLKLMSFLSPISFFCLAAKRWNELGYQIKTSPSLLRWKTSIILHRYISKNKYTHSLFY